MLEGRIPHASIHIFQSKMTDLSEVSHKKTEIELKPTEKIVES